MNNFKKIGLIVDEGADFRSHGWESAKRISAPPAEGRRGSQSTSGFC